MMIAAIPIMKSTIIVAAMPMTASVINNCLLIFLLFMGSFALHLNYTPFLMLLSTGVVDCI